MIARMLIAVRLAFLPHRQMDSYGFIRKFIPRLPSTLLVLGYKKKLEEGVSLFELVSIEYKGDSHICYYYADLTALGYRLNDNQKKSIAWLLSELNECVVSQVRT